MSQQPKRLFFYYLSAFSHTGGIEKFNRCFIKALNELPADKFSPAIVSVYDSDCDPRYNHKLPFRGFGRKRGLSVSYMIRQLFSCDILVLGHINLAVVGVLLKLLRPNAKLVVAAHGIETWPRLFFLKKLCLMQADQILSVSNYTKNQLVLRNKINPQKIRLFPNTIDPYFVLPVDFGKPAYLRERYGLSATHKIILTLSRLSSSEQEKGYPKVIAALPEILKQFPNVIYILAGKYDAKEKEYITGILKQHKVTDNVILTGYVPDEEVPDHYKLADVFIMPSRKEGFGIVFLEALACGTPVIGGNQDGTVDALHNGSLGTLINPTKVNEIADAIINHFHLQSSDPIQLQKGVLLQYQFIRYRERLETHLGSL
jgi:phosphatidylinositol alpha-1,6-mannosyltransferase